MRVRKLTSRVMVGLCLAAAAGVVALLVLVMTYLVGIGAKSLSLEFFTQVPSGDVASPGGMRHALQGTVVLLVIAGTLGIPMGVLTGIFLSEYGASRIASPVRFTADVLAGVPSIVVGILGYELLVVPLGNYNGWAGAGALAFIMIPIVARTTEEMLRLVPKSYREGSLALGATKSQTILRIVLPSVSGSVITGVMLALARVAGETAPLLFTALGSRLLSLDPNQPFPSLTVQIYTYATGPYPAQRDLAWSGILVLICLLFMVNVTVRVVMARAVKVKS
jgi:phosphate transport system permease protein